MSRNRLSCEWRVSATVLLAFFFWLHNKRCHFMKKEYRDQTSAQKLKSCHVCLVRCQRKIVCCRSATAAVLSDKSIYKNLFRVIVTNIQVEACHKWTTRSKCSGLINNLQYIYVSSDDVSAYKWQMYQWNLQLVSINGGCGSVFHKVNRDTLNISCPLSEDITHVHDILFQDSCSSNYIHRHYWRVA